MAGEGMMAGVTFADVEEDIEALVEAFDEASEGKTLDVVLTASVMFLGLMIEQAPEGQAYELGAEVAAALRELAEAIEEEVRSAVN